MSFGELFLIQNIEAQDTLSSKQESSIERQISGNSLVISTSKLFGKSAATEKEVFSPAHP